MNGVLWYIGANEINIQMSEWCIIGSESPATASIGEGNTWWIIWLDNFSIHLVSFQDQDISYFFKKKFNDLPNSTQHHIHWGCNMFGQQTIW